MRSIVNSLLLVIAAVLTGFSCGSSQSRLSDEQMQEINARAPFPDSVNPAKTIGFDFEDYATGELPEDWSEYYTGSGGTEWKIADDDGNKVMAQLYSDNPNRHFNVVINNDIAAKDMVLTVRLKGVTGRHDQGGGLVWRFTDKNNYYVVRANPLEDNVVLYKVENGRRTDLPLVGEGRTYGVDVSPLGSGWNSLKMVVKGDLFTVFLNDEELFKVQDDTFSQSGKVGLWSKADAVTYFDDFEIETYE